MRHKIDLFAQMLRIRLVEEEVAKRYSEQKMRCPTHLSIGQEAVAVGVSSQLSIEDRVYSSHRAHAHYLAKGGCINRLIAELYGKSSGCTGGRGGSMHLSDLTVGFVASTAIVGNSIPLAVGNALHQSVTGKKGLSICYFGDGATEEGAFYESLNFALVKNLPVLFVCENNRYSVYSSLEVRQPEGRAIHKLATAIGAKAYEVDGNNVEQVSQTTKEAVKYIKANNGPVFLECYTYRHLEHCGPNNDDDLNYRPQQEIDSWLEKDPLNILQVRFSGDSKWADLRQQIENDINSEITAAFEFAESSAFPDEQLNRRYLYAE